MPGPRGGSPVGCASPVPDIWEFRNIEYEPDHATYSDGTVVPGLDVDLYHNGVKVGEANLHMHKRRGRDGKTDVSFGATHITYGIPASGGN